MTSTAHRSLDQLEQEVERARAAVAGELAEVRRRLEPEGLKQQALDRARAAGAQLVDAGSQLVHERGRQLKDRVIDAAVDNPVPALALGTVAVWSIWRRLRRIPPPILLACAGGLAALMSSNDGTGRSDRGAERNRHGGTRPQESGSRSAPIGAAASGIGESATEAGASIREAAYATGTRVSEAALQAGSAVADAASRAGPAMSDVAERPASEMGRSAGDARAAARDLGRPARSGISDLVDRHPLVLGGIGLALGALIAAAFRPTEIEARLFGEASDRFKRRAREMLEEQFERAQTIDERAYQTASSEAQVQGVSVEAMPGAAAELGEKAGAVAESAKEAGKQKADELELGSQTA
jgi:hypothetical protein